jgi:rod shape determining protein RodA
MADFLAGNEHRLARFPVFVVSLIVATPPIILVFFQPDLGTTLVLVTIWLVMSWYAGIDRFYLLTLIFIAIPIVVIAWNYKYTDSTGQEKEIFSQYQRTRLEAFINPEAVAQGEGRNLITSRNAVTNGGLLGQGLGNGTNNKYNYLTIRHTDFIFSVIAEEFGFMGGIVLFTVLSLILLRILWVAQNAVDSFGRNICIGVMTMLLFQIVVNVGMNVGLMPVTGITLPLISQGNSSMWSVFMGLGLVQSVAMRSRREINWNYRTGPVLQ